VRLLQIANFEKYSTKDGGTSVSQKGQQLLHECGGWLAMKFLIFAVQIALCSTSSPGGVF